MPPGFLLRASTLSTISTVSTSIANTIHHLILVLGLCFTFNVLPIPHQQMSLSLGANFGTSFSWLCQSAVAHLLLGEDGEQLTNCHRAPAHRRCCCCGGARRSFGGVICVTVHCEFHCFPPPFADLGISRLDCLSSVGCRAFGDKSATVFPSLCVSH